MGLHVIAPLVIGAVRTLHFVPNLCTCYAYPVDNLVYNLWTVCAI